MIRKWLLAPSRMPGAPGYVVVFLFGALWNALIERSMWATLACISGVPIVYGVRWYRKRLS